MKGLRLWVVAGIVGASAAGCGLMMSPQQKEMMEQQSKQEIEMVGTLQKGSPGQGMEDTGWVFQSSAMGGMAGGGMAVDVSAVKAEAEANAGKRVVLKVTGLGAGAGGMTMKAMKVVSIESVGPAKP